jgi:hypothetical protein
MDRHKANVVADYLAPILYGTQGVAVDAGPDHVSYTLTRYIPDRDHCFGVIPHLVVADHARDMP